MPKNDNMLAILWMLNTGAKMTAKQISEKLEINIRTVYRYVDALCASGVPIISDAGHNGGYRLLNHHVRAPLLFDMEEKKALLQAAVFAKEAGHPLSEALDQATTKLRMYSNQEQERLLSRELAGFEVIDRKGSEAVQQVLTQLEQAIAKQYAVSMSYRTAQEDQPRNRRIDPYGMIYWNGKWYTVAYCHLRGELRSFRVDRIVQIEPTPFTFERPEDFSTRAFFMQNLLPNPAGKAGLTSVIIGGKPDALDDLCLHWYLGHYLKERTSDQAIFLLEEDSIHLYVPQILLSYGRSIQIIEPLSLKARLAAVAADLTAYYQQ